MKVNRSDRSVRMTYLAQANFLGSGAGGGARVKNMVNIFRKMDIKVDLISYSFNSEKVRIEHHRVDESLNLIVLHIPKYLPRFLKMFAVIPASIYAFKSCRHADIFYSDLITTIASLPMVLFAKLLDKPVILDYIDTKLIGSSPGFIESYVARNADTVFAISYYLLKKAKDDYSCKKVIYAPNSIDTDLFRMNLKKRKEIRDQYKFDNDTIVIGYAGAFIYWEGVPILIQAFKNLKEKYPNIKLMIMGNYNLKGERRDNIEVIVKQMRLEDEIIRVSSKPYEEVPWYLSACDILCCPKIDCEINRAANPVKVIDYLAMELPAVCSAVGGINDIIQDNVNGILIKPGDESDLENKLEWIFNNHKKALEIGKQGRISVINDYSFESLAIKLKDILEDLLN